MYFLSVNSSLPAKNAVFGVWPMARKKPDISTSNAG